MRRHAMFVFVMLACSPSGSDDGNDGSAGTTGGAGSSSSASSSEPSSSSASTSGTSSDGSSSATSSASTTSDGSTGSDSSSSGSDDDGSSTGDDSNVLYVREDGLDGNPGTREAPMRTIQWAITQAGVLGGIDTIRVAEGDYEVDYANSAHIVIAEGVSLRGGWSADWDERDPDVYATNIVDASIVDVPSSESDPHRSIEIPAGVTAATEIDGFRIGIDRGQFRAALFVEGDATIANNVIAPGSAGDPVWVYGLRVHEASPSIVGNRIAIDGGNVVGLATAIHAMNSDGLFANNVITLADATSTVYGIYLSQGSAQLLANSIHAGATTTNVYLVYMISAATPTIDNNVLEIVDQDGVCLGSNTSSAVPTFTRNNVLDCNYTLFGTDPLRSWYTIQHLEDGLDTATDNLKLPANILDPQDDLLLDAQVQCTVTQGGRDLGATISVDIDDVARTAPYSIGAHEWDAGCI